MSKRERRDPNENGLEAQIEFMGIIAKHTGVLMADAVLTSLKELDAIKKRRVDKLIRESSRF